MSDNFLHLELNNNSEFKTKWNDKINELSPSRIRWSIIVASLLFIVPTVGRALAMLMGWDYESNNSFPEWFTRDNIDAVMRALYAIGLFLGTKILLMGILLGRIKLKSTLDNIDAISALFAISGFALALFFPQAAVIFILLIWVNLYSFISRIQAYFANRFLIKNNSGQVKAIPTLSFEKFFFWAIPLSLLLYVLSYQADITLSEIFKIDPKHFTNTKPLVMLTELAPVLAIFTIFALVGLIIRLFQLTENNKLISYFSYLFSCLILFAISITILEGDKQLIRKYADSVDFNPKNICSGLGNNTKLNNSKISGAIYLDPAYKQVLLSLKNDKGVYSSVYHECKTRS